MNPQWQGWGASDSVALGTRQLALAVGRPVDVEIEVPDFHDLDIVNGVVGLHDQVQQTRAVLKALEQHRPRRLLYLAGDCGAQLAPIAWFNAQHAGNLTVVWIDAHADLNTPVTSPSATFHGMVLRALCGEGAPELVGLVPQPLTPDQIRLVGVRALDDAEADYIQRNAITRSEPLDVRLIGPVFVHIDLDCLDPSTFGHTPFREPGGLHEHQVVDLLQRLRTDPAVDLVGVGVTESTASLDELGAISRLCAQFATLLN